MNKQSRERSEREGPRGTNDDSNSTGGLLLYSPSSYAHGQNVARNGRNVTSGKKRGGACKAAKPTSKIKLIRLPWHTAVPVRPPLFSCDFRKNLFLIEKNVRKFDVLERADADPILLRASIFPLFLLLLLD